MKGKGPTTWRRLNRLACNHKLQPPANDIPSAKNTFRFSVMHVAYRFCLRHVLVETGSKGVERIVLLLFLLHVIDGYYCTRSILALFFLNVRSGRV